MGRPKVYVVHLSDAEREQLTGLVHKGKAPARVIQRAYTLLLSDEGKTDEGIAEVLHCSATTVRNRRERYASGGLEAVLWERARPGAQPRLDARGEAALVTLACSSPPEGRAHWTMQLLADRLVRLEVVEAISDETVRRVLKKTPSSRGRSAAGASGR
jgi:putative transposase